MHEAHVRDRVEEAADVGQHAVLDGVRPELARHLELLVDVHRLGDVDRAVGPLRGVVQLTQRRVAGARVVPRIAALGGGAVETLDQRDRPVRLHQPQQRAERGAHDSRADQHDVGLLWFRHRFDSPSCRCPLITAYRCSGYPAAVDRSVSTTDRTAPQRRHGTLGWLSCPDGSPTCCPATGSARSALGPDPDGEGELVATLVRRGEPDPSAARAVLVVHGFTDYFFHTELADHFAARGFAFYALDLHKCGRSWREGQTPHFTTDLARYDVELERALDVIAAEIAGATCWCTATRPAGSIVSLWLDRLRRRGATARKRVVGPGAQQPVAGPAGPGDPADRGRTARRSARCRGCARRTVVRPPAEGGYGTTLHRDYHGEFDYDLNWKPIGGFPVTFGWIHAIRRGHATLHRGLDVGVPEPDPALGPQRARGRRPRQHPARRRRARRRRRSPGGPAASATGPPSCRSPTPSTTCSCRCPSRARRPTANWTAGWTGTSTSQSAERHNTIRTGVTAMDSLRHRDHRHRLGQLDPRRALRRTSGSRSASRASSAAPASTSAASRPRCSSTPPKWPRPSGSQRDSASTRTSTVSAGPTSSRGCSAASTRSRWAARTTDGRRRTSRCSTATPASRPTQPDGRYALRTDDGDEFTADQVVIAAGSRAMVPDADRRLRRATITPATPSCGSPNCPSTLIIVGGGFVAAEFAHVFSALGTPGDDGDPRQHAAARTATTTICERFTDIASKKWEIRNHRNIDRGRSATASGSR